MATMLVLPMRSPSSSPSRQRDPSPYRFRAQEESPQTLELRKQVANTMLSTMPPKPPIPQKRPKLSLQTSLPSTLPLPPQPIFSHNSHSPTTKNTQNNITAANLAPPTPLSPVKPRADFQLPSTNCSTSLSSNKSHTLHSAPPSLQGTPYALPMGAHSILRNSPLPEAVFSATTSRPPKRVFMPTKHVTFTETEPEVMPTPTVEEDVATTITETGIPTPEEECSSREERKATIQQEDGHSTGLRPRSKRKREWIWRPVEDDDEDGTEREEEKKKRRDGDENPIQYGDLSVQPVATDLEETVENVKEEQNADIRDPVPPSLLLPLPPLPSSMEPAMECNVVI